VNRVGVGVIGTGSFGRKHVAAYSSLPNARVVAVYDRDRERAERVAREFGVETVCDSLEELVGHPRVQAVSVVTSEANHVEPALAALEAGKPVLVEKPLAESVEEARRLVAAAERTGGILMPGHILRFEVHYATVFEKIRRGEFGRLIAIVARRNRTQELFEEYQRTHPALETMIHDIDVALWFVGERPDRIHAWARNVGGKQHPNVLTAVLEFPSGVLATLHSSWTLVERGGLAIDDGLDVVGTDLTMRLDFSKPALVGWGRDGFHAPDLQYEPILMGQGVGALREELAYFVSCIQRGERPTRVLPQDGLAAVEVAHAIIAAAERNARG